MSIDIALARIKECIVERRVVLDLSDLGLTEIPPEIQKIPWLEKLDCAVNRLSSLEPVRDLKALTHLNCSVNNIESLEPVRELQALTELDCPFNSLKSLEPVRDLKALTVLCCSENELGSLEPVRELKALTELECVGNKLQSLELVRDLKALTLLVCSDNHLESLEPVRDLKALTELDCSRNKLQSLEPVRELKALTKLVCMGNKLDSLEPLRDLKALTQLDCSDNQLQSLEPVRELKALTVLVCSGNKLDSLEPLRDLKALTRLICSTNTIESFVQISESSYLRPFRCSNNPIKHIPHVFLDDIDNLRKYYQEIEAHGYLKNNRQKLLLLGNGRVGKTTLAWGLKESKPQKNVNQKSTIGISLLNWPMTDSEGHEWRVRIWDFGGQELYHATHRLFQSQSGVYCVVWAEKTREEESEYNHPLSYWLDLIHDSNTDVPVIVVKSQCDISDAQGFKNPALNDDRYCHYPCVRVSAWEGTGMKVLEAYLSDLFSVQAKLQTRIPKSWGKVRAKLETWGKTIDKSEFEELCRTLNVLHSDTLLTFLHTSGDVFFRDNYFSNTIFIDQNWALKAIYRLFETGEDIGNPRHWIERNKGRVSGKELVKIFSDYKPDEAKLFTGFMLQANMMFYEAKATKTSR